MLRPSLSRPALFHPERLRPIPCHHLQRISQTQRTRFSTQKPEKLNHQNRSRFLFLTAVVLASGGYLYVSGKPQPKHQLQAGFEEGSFRWQGHSVKPFSLYDVKQWLDEAAKSYSLSEKSQDVTRWDSIRLASNSPSEDTLVASRSPAGDGGQPWLFWGVFDGHNGPAMSETLKESLVPYVTRNLTQLYQSFNGQAVPPPTVDVAISSAFRQLDADILSDGDAARNDSKSFTEALSRLAPSFAGSCAILSIFDPNTSLLRVASVGDCRAVLGQRDASGSYTATPLSLDQTGFNKSELERVRAAHPGEADVIDVESGRLLGIAVTRAFGDVTWKWPKETLEDLKARYFWKALRPGYKTPPYMTAEPVITTTQIKGGGEFLVMASDGLWDHISSEQAVKLVEMWIQARDEGTIGKGPKKPQPVKKRETIWSIKPQDEDFVVEDENVAAHLVRNALGGCDYERLCGLAGAKPPYSRTIRDDITIQVILFDKNPKA